MDENSALTARYETIDAAEVRAMIDRKEPEGLTLDYKRFDPSGEPNKHDKDHVAEVVSGFANSAGGILIWGVATESRPGDSALPTSVVPIRDPRRAQARIRELASQLVQPPVSGVRVDAIDMGDGAVVKMLVPQSDDGPHRTAAKDGQYFRRAADRFDAMFHHEIAAAFARPRSPLLEIRVIEYGLVPTKGQPAYSLRVSFCLGNRGRALCMFPYARLINHELREIRSESSSLMGDFQIHPRSVVQTHQLIRDLEWVGSINDVIHPGSLICLINATIPIGTPSSPLPEYDIKFALAAQGMPLTAVDYRVEPADVLSKHPVPSPMAEPRPGPG